MGCGASSDVETPVVTGHFNVDAIVPDTRNGARRSTDDGDFATVPQSGSFGSDRSPRMNYHTMPTSSRLSRSWGSNSKRDSAQLAKSYPSRDTTSDNLRHTEPSSEAAAPKWVPLQPPQADSGTSNPFQKRRFTVTSVSSFGNKSSFLSQSTEDDAAAQLFLGESASSPKSPDAKTVNPGSPRSNSEFAGSPK